MICKNCGQNVQDGVAFCPACGANLAEAQQPAPAPAPAQTKTAEPLSGWKKIVNTISSGSAIAVAVFALIFLFTIGIQVTSEFMGNSTITQQEGGLFCYFNILSDILKMFEINPNLDINTIFTQLMTALFGMIATIAIIIVTIIFVIITLVKSIKALAKGVENNYLKFAGCTFAVFFVLSVAYGAISSVSATGGSMTISMGLNGAGIAGIILTGIFLLGAIGCKIAINLKSYINLKSIMAIIGTGVKVVCILLMVSFMTYTITETAGDSTTNYSVIQVFELIPILDTMSDAAYNALLSTIISLMFFVFLIFIMISNVMNAAHELSTMNTQISLRMPIGTIVFSLIYMIVSIITANSLGELNSFGSVTYSATFPIVIFVLSLVNLAGAIVRNVGAKKLA